MVGSPNSRTDRIVSKPPLAQAVEAPLRFFEWLIPESLQGEQGTKVVKENRGLAHLGRSRSKRSAR